MVGNSGGKPGRSGRKSKAHEMGLAALLDRCWTVEERENCIKTLVSQAKDGNLDATRLLLAYTYGKPKETHQVTGGAQGPVKLLVKYVKKPLPRENEPRLPDYSEIQAEYPA